MQDVRAVVRTLIAVFLASLGPVLAAPALRAHAQEITERSAVGTGAASPHALALTISVDSVSPRYAKPASIVTVSGTLSNHTGSAIPDIVVRAYTSSQPFLTRSYMDSFTAGGYGVNLESIPAVDKLTRPLGNGATTRWSISFPARADTYYSTFGVFPIQVAASYPAASSPAVDRTFLPYWPGPGSATPLQVAWIWPLIDTPQQGACPQTLNTLGLSGELASGGRLSTLLHTGLSWAPQDHLTWAIDPALLSDVSVMTKPYMYRGSAACSGRDRQPADAAASSWLSALQTGVAGQPAFITPYADVDVAALSHAGLDANLRTAYQLGETVASQVLPQTFGKTEDGSGGALPAAWPADGIADSGVLTSMATDGGVRAVVLRGGSLPSAAGQWDDALGLVKNDRGEEMPALLADSQLTSILGSASASSPAAVQFAAVQDFLAQTAMMAAEAPGYEPARSIVVAPPRRWQPSAGEASALLRLTDSAPWLQATGLSKLATESRQLSPRLLPARHVSHAELGGTYLDRLGELNGDLALYKDILYHPSQSQLATLDAAVAATQSVAWRGIGAPGGWLALTMIESYIADNENTVRLIAGKKILLAGTSGETPVSVQNGLHVPIQVIVQVSTPPDSPLSVGKFVDQFTVDPGKTITTRIPLTSSAIETTTMQLQLVTRNRAPLSWTAQQMSVQVTRYGRTLLVLIAAALGVLVLTSAARWYRRRSAGGRNDGSTDKAGAGGTG